MADDWLYLAIFLVGMVAGGSLGASLALMFPEGKWFKHYIADEAPFEPEPIPKEVTDFQERSVSRAAIALARAAEFDVTGKPRAVPWHIRKRELEEAARTKRRRLESFREAE
jgi:hypothetical protein